MTPHFAVQYIRMSTDKQDLSPSVQKDAIAAYAAERGLEIIASYEDEGRSGVNLKNRPGLLTLLRDVTGEIRQFSTVLVYDVSRWGRFQDTDAAAYHEYHCRLHGVEVIYVAEVFGAEITPMTTMLKSMKRAMAAEYSRDLAKKSRAGQHLVISRGYQIGPLPPLGFWRCSVSADGLQRVMLASGQRKAAATDRIEWVLAPQEEVDLVKRICQLYAHKKLNFNDLARLGKVEGWRDQRGRPISRSVLARLVRNEALIGNFVWGRKKYRKSIVSSEPSRGDGCIPRLIDDDTWNLIQRRRALEFRKRQTNDQILRTFRGALQRSPLLGTRDLRAQGLPGRHMLRTRLGRWDECLERAGQDLQERRTRVAERSEQRREHGKQFGIALAERLREGGYAVDFRRRRRVLKFSQIRMRVRLLWPVSVESGAAWWIRFDNPSRGVDFDLVARMEAPFRVKDFFVVPSADVAARFPHWLDEQVPAEIAPFWCSSPAHLLERIRSLAAKASRNRPTTLSLKLF